MAKLNRNEVIQLLSDTSGVPSDHVTKLFSSVARLAAEQITNGFLLPDLGELSLVDGPDRSVRNPATGETMTLPGTPVIRFRPDTETSDQLLNQRPLGTELTHKPPTVLPEIRLHPDASDWETAQQANTLHSTAKHKLGGKPAWVQNEIAPICCARGMTFYGQFDSSVGGVFNLMDAAVILVFVCDYCYKPRAILQSY